MKEIIKIIVFLFILGTIFTITEFCSKNILIQRTDLAQLHSTISHLEQQVKTINSKLIENNKRFSLIVEATAYTPRKEECNNDWMNTATMKKPKPGSHIAVSQDLIWMLGKKVYVEGLGIRYVEDLMNKRFTNRIDIMMNSVKKANNFGLQNLELIVLEN